MRTAFLYVLLVTAAAGQTASRPFSHELHLKLQPKCEGCHQKAPQSTEITDNLLPDPKVCLTCHQNVRIQAPVRTWTLARFPHKTHVALGNFAPVIAAAIDSGAYLSKPGDLRQQLNVTNNCLACHHGMDHNQGPVTRANFPQMAECLVCHNKVDAPFSCETCHMNTTPQLTAKLKPADHVPGFLDLHNRKDAKLDKESCAVCHGRKFTCLGCH